MTWKLILNDEIRVTVSISDIINQYTNISYLRQLLKLVYIISLFCMELVNTYYLLGNKVLKTLFLKTVKVTDLQSPGPAQIVNIFLIKFIYHGNSR